MHLIKDDKLATRFITIDTYHVQLQVRECLLKYKIVINYKISPVDLQNRGAIMTTYGLMQLVIIHVIIFLIGY